MKRNLFSKVMLSTCIGLLLLAGLEVGCRQVGLGKPPSTTAVARYIADWQGQWNSEFRTLRPGKGVNQDGLRDQDHARENPNGLQRIVCLGDSVTFGFRVSFNESYPALLEKAILEQQRPVEVFNMGVPGWSTRQQAIAYRTLAQKYSPDHVVLGVCLNDIPEMQNNLTKPSPVMAALYRRSYLVRALIGAEAREVGRVQELFIQPSSGAVRSAWALTLAEIAELAEEVRGNGSRFSLIVFPFRFQVLENAPEPVPQRVLRDFCVEHRIPFLDVLPALLPLGKSGFIDYDHLSFAGASAVVQAILDSGLVLPQ